MSPIWSKPVTDYEHPSTMTVEQAGALLGISRRSAYRAAAAGHIPTSRLGRRILVPTTALYPMLSTTLEHDSDPDGSHATAPSSKMRTMRAGRWGRGAWFWRRLVTPSAVADQLNRLRAGELDHTHLHQPHPLLPAEQ